MKTHDEITPFGERKVVRRGMLAGLAGLGAAAMMKLTGTQTAEAALTNLTYPGASGDVATHTAAAITTWQSSPPGGSGYTLLKVQNLRVADAIEAVGGPGSLGNAGGRGVNATGGSNDDGTFGLPSNAGDAIEANGGTTAGGVGNGGRGVRSFGGNAGTGTGGTGVEGTGGAPSGTGVRGNGGGTTGARGNGVNGFTNSTLAGVQGTNGGSGPGVQGNSGNGPGVDGVSTNSLGIRGTSTNFVGVVGISTNSHGLYGSTSVGVNGFGIVAENLGANGPGLFVNGGAPSQILGGLQVFGPKNAVLKMQDGTFASVYCQESPEPYFEDFGRAQLVGGVASVPLEREFATLVAGGDYMVTLTPEGPSWLYVSRRGPAGFEVREGNNGTSNVSFTYRIVTRRKDIEGKRFARVDTSAAEKVAGVRAVLAGMGTAGPAPHPSSGPSGPSSPLPPQQAVPPIFTNTPPVIPGGNGYTNLPPGAP